MKIRVIGGPPCSGKSSYAELNAPDDSCVFDTDAIATAAGWGSNHDHARIVTATLNAMRRGVIGWATDPEADHPDGELWLLYSWMPDKLYELLVSAGAEFTVLDPGRDTCLIRARADDRPGRTIADINQWYDNPPAYARGSDSKGGEAMRSLNTAVKLKAAGDDGTELGDGEFVAYASVFGNVDAYGDVVKKGAFADTLADWADSGNVLPVLYGHDFADPMANIGAVVKAEEDERGLKITGRLDLDNPKAAQVFRLLKGRRLSQMSFAFDVLDSGPVDVDGVKATELRRLKLYEVSVVPIGANQDTEVLAVKATMDGMVTAGKAGHALSAEAIHDLGRSFSALRDAATTDQAVKASTPPSSAGDPVTDPPVKAADDRVPVSALVAKLSFLNMKGA